MGSDNPGRDIAKEKLHRLFHDDPGEVYQVHIPSSDSANVWEFLDIMSDVVRHMEVVTVHAIISDGDKEGHSLVKFMVRYHDPEDADATLIVNDWRK